MAAAAANERRQGKYELVPQRKTHLSSRTSLLGSVTVKGGRSSPETASLLRSTCSTERRRCHARLRRRPPVTQPTRRRVAPGCQTLLSSPWQL